MLINELYNICVYHYKFVYICKIISFDRRFAKQFWISLMDTLLVIGCTLAIFFNVTMLYSSLYNDSLNVIDE